MTIYVLSGFNNYYNRIVKKFDTVEEYMPYELHTQENFNFVPNDNVNTQVVLGNLGNEYTGEGDYLLVTEMRQVPDDAYPDRLVWKEVIVSRWFIIESVRDRAGQYTLTLHRDLVVDHYDEVLDAPMFIEKATLPDSDPAIWNSEGIAVNQIKTNEYVLRDKTRCAWIVGYMKRDFLSQDDSQAKTFQLSTSAPIADFVLSTPIDNWPYYGLSAYRNSNAKLYFDAQEVYSRNEPNYYRFEYSAETKSWSKYEITNPGGIQYRVGFGYGGSASGVLEKLKVLSTIKLNEALTMYQPDATSTQEDIIYNELKNTYNNSTIEDSNGDTFKVSLRSGSYTRSVNITSNILDEYYIVTAINNVLDGYGTGSRTYRETYTRNWITPILSTVSDTSGSVTIPTSSKRPHLSDAPYDMFCIPCNLNDYDITMFLKGKSGEPASPPDDATINLIDYHVTLGFVQDLARQLDEFLIDIQLLPFCPIRGFEFDETTNTLRFDNIYYAQYNTIQVSTGIGNAMFWVSNSEGSYFSNELDLVDTLTNTIVNLPLPIDNFKLTNECDMYRLCSPNYNGQFEFNASKINGITGFNVDYTYLPYSPYIKISPNFAGLYGQDFDDVRGLICQGDFSISYMSDPWINYQIQNKNYANVFNRQIQNMEVTQDIERKKQVFNAVTGTVMGGAGGALAGSKAGPYGAIAGAIVGTAASAVGGALDVHYGDILRSEALDYTKDMFAYQLDNIKALPDSIQKVTAYTKNNKIFPVLEYYTCTKTEKRAIANKIAWNGMTTMRIGTMSEFIGNNWSYGNIESKGYIKGKLIRLDTINDDYHIVNALSGELDKGVFIQ